MIQSKYSVKEVDLLLYHFMIITWQTGKNKEAVKLFKDLEEKFIGQKEVSEETVDFVNRALDIKDETDIDYIKSYRHFQNMEMSLNKTIKHLDKEHIIFILSMLLTNNVIDKHTERYMYEFWNLEPYWKDTYTEDENNDYRCKHYNIIRKVFK